MGCCAQTSELKQHSFDGAAYEIDLTDVNVDKLHEAFSDHIASGRKIGGRSNRTDSTGRTDPTNWAISVSGLQRRVMMWRHVAVEARQSAKLTAPRTEGLLVTLNPPNKRPTTQHIGAAGELLVQYQLLKLGIDSARLTTDAGIDLVVYAPATGVATTMQVKTVERSTPTGGRGRLAIGWNFPHDTPAQLLAFTAPEVDRVWLITAAEAREVAQQHTPGGTRRLYWYTDESTPQRDGVPLLQADMERYALTARAPRLFPR
jgi:hypothetical protein